jgi:hypothetical protein
MFIPAVFAWLHQNRRHRNNPSARRLRSKTLNGSSTSSAATDTLQFARRLTLGAGCNSPGILGRSALRESKQETELAMGFPSRSRQKPVVRRRTPKLPLEPPETSSSREPSTKTKLAQLGQSRYRLYTLHQLLRDSEAFCSHISWVKRLR